MSKECVTCKIVFPYDNFNKRVDSKDGLRNQCNKCRGKIHTIWHRKTKFGLSEESFHTMMQNQDSKCAICKKILVLGIGTHIDHCHLSGKIRGLLCNTCNTGIGLFKESLESLESAIQYLKFHQTMEQDSPPAGLGSMGDAPT
jgi:hypothetical protein